MPFEEDLKRKVGIVDLKGTKRGPEDRKSRKQEEHPDTLATRHELEDNCQT